MAQHISMKLDMKQVIISSIEFNFLQPISQQICPSWLPIDRSATVISAQGFFLSILWPKFGYIPNGKSYLFFPQFWSQNSQFQRSENMLSNKDF